MLVNELLEDLVGGEVFLNCGNLIPGDVFGYIFTVFAVLEIVVRLAVGPRAEDGEVSAFHPGNFGQLCDAFGKFGFFHADEYMRSHIRWNKKMTESQRILIF